MSFFKKHFWAKSMVAAATVLALGSISVVDAAKKKKGTWKDSTIHVAAHGTWNSRGPGNVKKTNSNVASFRGKVVPNALGYTARLIDRKGSSQSDKTRLMKNKTSYAKNNQGKIGHTYYADVRSNWLEPTSSRVKLDFSADKK